MPANLNALIRYKTIDRLLRNKYIRCDIRRLQEACSEALGEARGRREKVSVRTIRDDIRVMRSDMLEFNAPIVCEEGYYSYSDPTYSIFNVSLNDQDVIRQVISILVAHRNTIQYPSLPEILETLGNMAGIDISDMQPQTNNYRANRLPIEEPLYMIVSDDERKRSTESSKKSLSQQEDILRAQDADYLRDAPKCSMDLSQPPDTAAFSWGSVLQML